MVVDWWWWVIGRRRCDGDNVLLVPDETTWMDGWTAGYYWTSARCGTYMFTSVAGLREHVRTCHACDGRWFEQLRLK